MFATVCAYNCTVRSSSSCPNDGGGTTESSNVPGSPKDNISATKVRGHFSLAQRTMWRLIETRFHALL